MATKYYFTERANFPVEGISFVIHDICGGTPVGTYSTDNPAEIEMLDKHVQNKKSSVQEISQQDFEVCRKKKPLGPPSWTPLSVPSPTQVFQPPMQGQGAQVATDPGQVDSGVTVSEPVETVDAALNVGSASEPATPPSSRKKK